MNSRTPLIGIGAGGHAKSVLGLLLEMPRWNVIGLLDPSTELHGSRVLGIPVLGDDDQLDSQMQQSVNHVFLGIGTPRNTSIRQRVWGKMIDQGLQIISVVAPSAIISRHASYGVGFTCLPGAIVQAGAVIGDNVLINSGAIIEHDCQLSDHVHIASGATLAGDVIVGSGAFIGAGASVRPGTQIGENAVIGCGAVVVQDVPPAAIVVGNPAKPIHREEKSWMIHQAS